MQNKKNAPKIAKNAKLQNANLAQFADQLSQMDIKTKNAKETIYAYPDTLTKDEINGEKGKKWRNARRNALKRFANNIFAYSKTEDMPNLQKTIADFDKFYAENFKIQDYTLSSLTATKNETKERDLKLMLQIINALKSA